MNDCDAIAERFEQVYRRVQDTRMRGLPFLNRRLQVASIGFQRWQGRPLGVVLTPWFMGLVLLPAEDEDWSELRIGDKRLHRFPSGPYEFIIADLDGIGRHQSCSLFSPMDPFADQQTALATAQAVIDGLMDEQLRDSVSTREQEIERRWRGETGDTDDAVATLDDEPANQPAEESRLQQPVSRRAVLRRLSGAK